MLNGFAVIAGLSVTGSVMILILLIAKKVLKKRHGVSRRAFVFLWLLVFLRMCLPFGVDMIQPEGVPVLPGQAVCSALTAQISTEPAQKEAGTAILDASAADAGGKAFISPETGVLAETGPTAAGYAADGKTAVSLTETVLTKAQAWAPLAIRIAAAVWLAGAVGMAGMLAFSYFRKLREIGKLSARGIPLIARTALLNAKNQTGIDARRVQIRMQEGSGGAVYGIFRPIIVLGRDSVLDAEMVLTHECVHIRHWDNLLKVLAFGVLSVHWFNPLAWIAVRSFCRDIEMSCDESVLKSIHSDSRKHYAVTILGSSRVRGRQPGFSYFGESPVSERVKHVLGIRKKQVAAPVAAVLTAVFLLLGCFASPVAAVTEEILEYGGSLDSGFVDFAAVSEQDGEILDYTAYEEGSLFVVRDNEGIVKIVTADSRGGRTVLKELPDDGGEFIGAVYYHDGKLYYPLRQTDHIDLMAADVKTGATENVSQIGNTKATMRLFGGSHYLCWYEERRLQVMDLETGRIEQSFLTNGNQDYGAMEDGYLAYQYRDDAGVTRVRCVSPETGDAFEAESRLGEETFSAYGNSRFIIYKEEYKLQSKCFIYDREKQSTVRLIDFMDPEYVKDLKAKKWGITLVGNRLLIFGEGTAVYDVNLETGETAKHESGRSGVGFYHLKNSDGQVSAMLFTVQESRGLTGSGNLYVGRFMR